MAMIDRRGLFEEGINAGGNVLGHSDFAGNETFDYNALDSDHDPFNPLYTWEHFRDLPEIESDLRKALSKCDFKAYQYLMHEGQDYFTHYSKGFRWWTAGHIFAFPGVADRDPYAWGKANNWTKTWFNAWVEKCQCKK